MKPYFIQSVRRAFPWALWQALGAACLYAQLGVTDIAVTSTVSTPHVKRLGINLGGSNYYDSGQMMKNLLLNNPGFEGEIYQSIIRCASGTALSCVDDNTWSSWPKGFWDGATFEFFYGGAQGRVGKIGGYAAANGSAGGMFAFSSTGVAPGTGDYMIVRMTVPGNAAAGWWPSTSGGATIGANFADLAPGAKGAQTIALSSRSADALASIAGYFDSTDGVSFVQLNGSYQLSFKAKGAGGSNSINLEMLRFGTPNRVYLDQTINLTDSWQTYTATFQAAETGAIGTVQVQFSTVGQDSFLLDDVSLTQTDSDPSNQSAFRDPVVNALRTLKPGVLRYWAGQLGDTLDNLIAEPGARQRAGFSAFSQQQDDISYGLHEFLELCASVDAEPWFVVPTTFSVADASHLIEYLAADSHTLYGTKRAARGQLQPWTHLFPKIHLEFGNEAWNDTFAGGTIEYPAPYGNRAQSVFAAMRGNTAFDAASFDLVIGGQEVYPARNQAIQNNCDNNDSFAIATYMMGAVDAFTSVEDLFGSTFAEPEAFHSAIGRAEDVDGPGGLVYQNQQAIQSTTHPVPLTIYETNMNTLGGSITQDVLNRYESSLGAGIAVVENMMLGMRQFGITTQNLFSLPQYQFERPDGQKVYLWGSVIDMGGNTNRKRPAFLALELANKAIGKGSPNLLQTIHSGADPTWNQPLVNTVQLDRAHYLQSFALVDGVRHSLIVFNLHRVTSLPVTFSGTAPQGTVEVSQLTSASITDTNELDSSANIEITGKRLESFNPSSPFSLPLSP